MKRTLLSGVFSLVTMISFCQLGLNSGEGAKVLSMGGAGSSIIGAYSIFNNQAGMVEVDDLSIVLDVQRRFSLADLTAVSAGIIKSTKLGHFGLMMSNYGSEVFKDQKIGISYARNLSDILSIGAQFNTLILSIDEFGSSTNFSVEAGVLAKLSSELFLSAHVNNPVAIELTDNSDIETRFRTGLRYLPSAKLELVGELDKILDSPMNFRFGISYNMLDKIKLRIGYSTTPGTVSFGIGYEINSSLVFDGAYSFHEQLGYTPGISLLWNKLSK